MWISTGLCRALYTKHKYVWPYSSWPWPALIKLSCTAPLNAPTLLPLSIFLVLLSPIHLFLTFPCLHSRWWGSLSFPSLTCPRHLVNTMLWLVNGGWGGLPLSITANLRPVGLLNVCLRAKTCCMYCPSTLPLWSKQEHSSARTKDHGEGG